MRGRAAIAAAAAVVSLISTRAVAIDAEQLQRAVWTLASLQDRTANGDAEAARLQARLIGQIEADIRRFPDELLNTPQNLQALATVLLSGANPNVVEAHTLNLEMDENSRHLLNGALAYARADREGAAAELEKVDIAKLPPSLAGRVALVRSIIAAGENPLRAIDDLHEARRLMPGTLVEEASLRRCVAFSGKIADMERLRFCSSRYMRRFPNSLYWQEFETSFALAVAQSGLGEGQSFARLLDSTERLPVPARRQLLLRLARAALTHGRLQLAMGLAEKASELSIAGSAEMQRARLYRAAAELVTEKFEEGRTRLAAVNAALLSPEDAVLLDKAMRLLGQIEDAPPFDAAGARQILFQSGAGEQDAKFNAAVGTARAAIDKAQKVVGAEPAGVEP
jgi:chemotaxis protein MotC